MRILFLISISLFFVWSSSEAQSIVLVRSTVQYPNFLQPWRVKNPENRSSYGIYLGNQTILCPAPTLYYATTFEVKIPNSLKTYSGKILKLDSDLGLALVQIQEMDFGKSLIPISFGKDFFLPQTVIIEEYTENPTSITKKGEVSKLEVDTYTNGYTELPYAELQSNEKLEGIGELVLDANSKLPQGILISFKDSQNLGKIVPNFQIKKFLECDKSNECFPNKGFRYRPLLDKSSREFYLARKEEQGVSVAEVIRFGAADGMLKTEDIILEISGYKVDPKGNFLHPKFGKLSINYLFHSGHELNLGSNFPIKILRDKRIITLNFQSRAISDSSIRIPHGNTRNAKPKALVVGGAVFLELSEQMLSEFGNQWRSRVDKKFLYWNDFHKYSSSSEDGKIIILTQVFPISSNKAYHSYSQLKLNTINDKGCKNLEECKTLVNSIIEKEEFLIFQFEDGHLMVFKTKELSKIETEIFEQFGVPSKI